MPTRSPHFPSPPGGAAAARALVALLVAAAPGLAGPEAEGALGVWRWTADGLESPRALQLGADGSLWIAESGASRIVVLGPGGERRASFGERGSGDGQLEDPGGLAVAAGRVWVADTGNHRVAVFDDAGGWLGSFGELGTGPGEFHTPEGIAADGRHVAVADRRNGRVQLFDAEGRFLRSFEEIGPDERLRRPVGVALVGERLYALDADRDLVFAWELDGDRPALSFGGYGFFPGLLSDPSGLAAAGGELFVADTANHRVQVFRADGEATHRFGLHAIRPREGEGKLHYPAAVAIAPELDRVAVAEPLDDRVQVFGRAREGERVDDDPFRVGIGQASPHYGTDVAADGPWMAIAEPESGRVLIHDTRPEDPIVLSRVGGHGERLGLLRRPSGLALHARTLFVSDAATRRLSSAALALDPEAELRFDPGLARFVRAIDFGRLGKRVAGLELEWTIEPGDLACERSGRLWLLDTANQRVFRLGEDLVPELGFGGHGSGPGRFRRPVSIALATDDSRLYVVDGGNRRVQAFDTEGRWLFELGGGELDSPHGVAAAPDGTVWVSDAGAHRVLVFDEGGRLVRTLGRKGIGRLEFLEPRGVAVDGEGRVIVIDHGNHRGQILSPEGEYLAAFGTRLYTLPARLPHVVERAEAAGDSE